MIPSNGIRWDAVRARCDIIRLYAVGIVMLNGILAGCIRTVGDHDSWCPIETVFQIVTHQSEVWQAHPACFDCAWSRHTMAFTFLTHLTLNMLFEQKQTEREKKINKSNSKRFYCKMKLLKIDTIHVSKKRRVFLLSISFVSCSQNQYINNNSTARNVFISLE